MFKIKFKFDDKLVTGYYTHEVIEEIEHTNNSLRKLELCSVVISENLVLKCRYNLENLLDNSLQVKYSEED